MATTESMLCQMLCKLQTREAGSKTTLLEHLKELVMAILDEGDTAVDTALLSIALKRKVLQKHTQDRFLPVNSKQDVSQLVQALALFGYDRGSCCTVLFAMMVAPHLDPSVCAVTSRLPFTL